MNVMIIHPFRTIHKKDFAIISIGMILSANRLIKAGHNVIGINLPMEQSINEKKPINISTYLATYKPDIIIISFH
jgi:hypothetical protein